MRRNGVFGILGLGAAMALAVGGAGPVTSAAQEKAIAPAPRPARAPRKREILHAAGIRYRPIRARWKPMRKPKHRNMLHVSKRTRRKHRKGKS